MACPKCKLTVNCKSDVFTMCAGSCFQSFHAACVGLTELVVRNISKNVIWLCDDCLASFYDQITHSHCPETNPTNINAELTAIKEQIASITEVLSTVIPQTQGETASSIQSAPCHSTPISTSRLNRGCRADGANMNNCSYLSNASRSVVEENTQNTFSLFLTNIDASVTEQEMSNMVAQSLRVVASETIKVVKLVPKWKINESLQYASFKIRLDTRLKRSALQSTTWPMGVMFREFIEHPRRTWKPANGTQTAEILQQGT